MSDNTKLLTAPDSHATLAEREAGLRLLASSQQTVPPNGILIKVSEVDEVADLKTNGKNGVSKEFAAMQTEIEQEYRQIKEERARLKREERAGAVIDVNLVDEQRRLNRAPAPGSDMVWDTVLGYGEAKHAEWKENRETIVAREGNYRQVTTAFMNSELDLRQVQQTYDRAFQLERQGKRAEALQLLKDADRTLDTSLTTIKGSSHLTRLQHPNSIVPALYDNAERNAGRAQTGLEFTRNASKVGLALAPGAGPLLAVGSSVVSNVGVMIDSERHGTPMRQAGSEFLDRTTSDLTDIAVTVVAKKVGAAAGTGLATRVGATGVAGVAGKAGAGVVESSVNEVATRVKNGGQVFDRTLPVDIVVGALDFGSSKAPGVRGMAKTVARKGAETATGIGLELVSSESDGSDTVSHGAGKVTVATVKEMFTRVATH